MTSITHSFRVSVARMMYAAIAVVAAAFAPSAFALSSKVVWVNHQFVPNEIFVVLP